MFCHSKQWPLYCSKFLELKQSIHSSYFKCQCSDRTTCIRHQSRKTTVLSCPRCLIHTGVGKNEQPLNRDYNIDHYMSLSKEQMLVFKQLFTFFKACCSIRAYRGKYKQIRIKKKNTLKKNSIDDKLFFKLLKKWQVAWCVKSMSLFSGALYIIG